MDLNEPRKPQPIAPSPFWQGAAMPGSTTPRRLIPAYAFQPRLVGLHLAWLVTCLSEWVIAGQLSVQHHRRYPLR